MLVNSIKKLMPATFRRYMSQILGLDNLDIKIAELKQKISELETTIESKPDILAQETHEQLWHKSRERWKAKGPDDHLTWGIHITGDAFIEKVISHRPFKQSDAILEVGPGYGRLLESILRKSCQFSKYVGVDISSKNIEYLRQTFNDPRISFIHGDFEDLKLNDTFDVFISSLVFKHLYPSFQSLLSNVYLHMKKGSFIFFDFYEHDIPQSNFTGNTFVRVYSRQEVTQILESISFELLGFDEVIHDTEHHRPLVIATRL